ncbi:NAD-dependent epimerase/dehydratase family protein [Clostridium sp. MB40-C1]|uniref:NAD-dependent epimerase/dehydratase family protein n=1 Tax=Clostridium sp. MB40-C1 TaxID=3070996 RepID=UPI0027DFFCEB|nr:NAD-dependent epimerase/dehydratase family protein [Clostridium sp. MB40-C1]WMJ81124.1 NAD-dependent epimerase/dehydratase family protein [Clostridium sp. MB40-C1]
MIAVIGSSGFIGKNIQLVLKQLYREKCSEFIMVYFNNYDQIDNCFKKIRFQEFINDSRLYNEIETIIITSGNSNRNINSCDFNTVLKKDTEYILELKDKFDSNLVLLSSGAVYDGKSGKVSEKTHIMPNSLYGMCKYNSEVVAKYVIDELSNKKLIIYRLMYAYGKFEKNNRLFPLIALKIKSGKVFNVNGYNNYLNPLSGEFVARVFIETALKINDFPKFDIINLASSKKFKLVKILEIMKKQKGLRYRLVSEEPCLKYILSTDKLEHYLNKLDIDEEDIEKNIIKYIDDLF